MPDHGLRRLSTYTVYINPTGYSVREFYIDQGPVAVPGPVLAAGLESLDAARDALPPWADFCMPRDPEDDPTIVESWM